MKKVRSDIRMEKVGKEKSLMSWEFVNEFVNVWHISFSTIVLKQHIF